MERRGKYEERLMMEKLKRGVLVGEEGHPSTPPPPWRLEFPSRQNKNSVQEFLNFPTSTLSSARKLCAELWQAQPSHQHRISKPGIRLRHHIHHHLDQPASTSRGFSRHVQAPLVQHHRSVNGRTLQPVSPASYSSSMQIAPYNHVSPTNCIDLKDRIRESSSNPRTSRELLNRIWCLEEQHASNISAVKALKKEVDLCRARIKELVQEKQLNKQEMVNIMKHIREDKLVRKNKEHDKIKETVQSVKEEIENERRLRNHSENLYGRLAWELSEAKSSLSGTLRELERERKTRILLENLCDDFAKGIRDYGNEVRSLVHNAEEGHPYVKGDSHDMLVLHLSEAWLHERMQMKPVQAGNDHREIDSIVDKLGVDIESFLRRFSNSSTKEFKEIYRCLHSSETFPLKEATSAPHNIAEEDSIGTDIFEQKNISEVDKERTGRHNSGREKVQSKEITEDGELQLNGGKNMSCDENERWFLERKTSEMGGDSRRLLNTPGTSTLCEGTQSPPERSRLWTKRTTLSHRFDNTVRNSSLSSEGDKVYPESVFREDSCLHSTVTGGSCSTVKQWKPTSDFDKSESCSKLHSDSSKTRGVIKDNTLMAKLLEARLEEHKSRSRRECETL